MAGKCEIQSIYNFTERQRADGVKFSKVEERRYRAYIEQFCGGKLLCAVVDKEGYLYTRKTTNGMMEETCAPILGHGFPGNSSCQSRMYTSYDFPLCPVEAKVKYGEGMGELDRYAAEAKRVYPGIEKDK